ncbi:replication protein B (plasmid) [Hartmannibacter diazotrophicus]|uniref:Replication protein B n=1 Tax=Hartmannibacter diazotrophicus TaxID=1482074 RepID=A0A2C9DDW8_9HYPH|nr:plasmid partitioning protein RepB [Hartmannibacter diazotrophicus]SON58494.1 replication protein B [Hartmannibacter diazotrophicus]
MKKGRDILQGLVAAGKPLPPSGGSTPQARPSGAVKAMSLGLDRLSAEAAQAKALREELANRETTQELDTGLFSPSPISDRIPLTDDPRTEELRAAIELNGQQIPIIARPHPDKEGHFQIAAGHRRWRVAQDLGRPLKAIIRKLTDEEMVILQGQENGPREDLTFAERARFALQMEARGFNRDTLSAALNVDKPELSRLLTVAQALSEEFILAIGPAPKVGRPRWLQLAKGLAGQGAHDRLAVLIRSPEFAQADTDRRFGLALEVVGTANSVSKKRLAAPKRIAWIEKKGSSTRLVSNDKDFAEFIQRRLPELLKEFQGSLEADADDEKRGTSH